MNKLPYKILVVEDDPTALEFLESCFNGKLSTAVSLKEAWEEMKKSKPDRG